MEVYTLVEDISLEIKQILRLREAFQKLKAALSKWGEGSENFLITNIQYLNIAMYLVAFILVQSLEQ